MGGTYEFTRIASANLREKDDSLNTAIGGFLAGSIMGLRCENFNGSMMCGEYADVVSQLAPRPLSLVSGL
jgi:hypothetical protein